MRCTFFDDDIYYRSRSERIKDDGFSHQELLALCSQQSANLLLSSLQCWMHEERKDRGISRSQLASHLGVYRNVIRGFEQGYQTVRLSLIWDFAQIFDSEIEFVKLVPRPMNTQVFTSGEELWKGLMGADEVDESSGESN